MDSTALDLPHVIIGDGFLSAKATSFRRFPPILRDLEYILETPQTASSALTSNLPYPNPPFSALWARFLRLSQGIDKISRQR